MHEADPGLDPERLRTAGLDHLPDDRIQVNENNDDRCGDQREQRRAELDHELHGACPRFTAVGPGRKSARGCPLGTSPRRRHPSARSSTS